MRVLHIIPSAFDYFDDIRQLAFAELQAETALGIEAEAFTLQYGAVSKQEQDEVGESAPSHQFKELLTLPNLINVCNTFDIVHVHGPLLGALPKLITWKKNNPDHPLICTLHRPMRASDLFGWFISWYNAWYLPKLVALADVTVMAEPALQRQYGKRVKATAEAKFVLLTGLQTGLTAIANQVQLSGVEETAQAYAELYESLLNN